MPFSVHIEKLIAEDLAQIEDLARIIWNQHYPDIIAQEQIDYMLNQMYNEASLIKQNTEGQMFYLVLIDGAKAGFVSVSFSKSELFIHKFYIHSHFAGKKVGETVFKSLIDIYKPSLCRLTVNRQNYKSINFYFKIGFKIEKVADFDIGNGFVMNDFVMKWENTLLC